MHPGIWNSIFFFLQIQGNQNSIDGNGTGNDNDENRKYHRNNEFLVVDVKSHNHDTDQQKYKRIGDKGKKFPVLSHHMPSFYREFVSTVVSHDDSNNCCGDNCRNRDDDMIDPFSKQKCCMGNYDGKGNFEELGSADKRNQS